MELNNLGSVSQVVSFPWKEENRNLVGRNPRISHVFPPHAHPQGLNGFSLKFLPFLLLQAIHLTSLSSKDSFLPHPQIFSKQNLLEFCSVETHTGIGTQEDASLQKHLVLPTLLDPWAWSSGVMDDLRALENFSQCLGRSGHGREKQA